LTDSHSSDLKGFIVKHKMHRKQPSLCMVHI